MITWLIWHGPEAFSAPQLICSIICGGGLTGAALWVIFLQTLNYKDGDQSVKASVQGDIREGYKLLGAGLMMIAFGPYFLGIWCIVSIIWITSTLIESIPVAVKKNV